MQTFLPYRSFKKSANVLDKKRCWKQVVEAKQILNALQKISSGETKVAWGNHPAVKMWIGYEEALKEYYNAFLEIAITKHKINTVMKKLRTRKIVEYPWWLSYRDFHRAMRARLIEKDYSFYYSKFFADEHFNNAKYLWPDTSTKTFYEI